MNINELENALINFNYPRNINRPNVAKKEDWYKGMAMGLVRSRPCNAKNGNLINLSCNLKKKKYNELFNITNDFMKTHHPDKEYTTIQYNQNHKCLKHKDGRNVGESYIIGFGDYEGGELIVYDKDGNNPVKHDIKHKFFKFNGALYPHETADFTGERITLVFFNVC
tara:strand:- start:699 stop:1199 length:501 start_codon:yes stop_codon:yes gene_type:complete